ncbi:hypothetical protein ACY2DA_03060 [Staphylococcus simulans]
MTRMVVVEDISLTATYLLDTLTTMSYEVVVLHDSTRQPVRRPEVTYQPIDYLNRSHWQAYIEKDDIVLMNALPEMFGDGLWQGDMHDLRQLIKDFVWTAKPIKVIEYVDVIAKQETKTKQALSLQQMSVPLGYTVEQCITAYAQYLKKISLGLIQVTGQPERFDIQLCKMKRPLIAMNQASVTHDMKLAIQPNSLLYQPNKNGSSFYFIHSGTSLYTCLTHFTPSLPWLIYRASQAVIHDWVMRGFRRYLKGLNPGNDK